MDLSINIENLNSNDITTVVSALNKVNRLIYENAIISTTELGNLLINLSSLLDVIHSINITRFRLTVSNIWNECNHVNDNSLQYDITYGCQNENVMLLLVLNIIRNLSQESNNEYLIASNTVILKHLVEITEFASSKYNLNNINSEPITITFDILSNIINKMDFHSGATRFRSIFDSFLTNKDKSELKLYLSPHFSTVQSNYTNICNHFFQIVYHNILKPCCNRILLIKCLELFIKLANISDNISMFVQCPVAFIDRLVQLLETSHTYNPSLGNFHLEVVDTECRDLSIEIIYTLCSSSNRLQIRFSQHSKLLKVLFYAIKSCRTENRLYRNSESTLRMISIFSSLVAKRGSTNHLQGVQNEMLLDAFNDSDFLDLCLNVNLSDDFIYSFTKAGNSKTNVENLKLD